MSETQMTLFDADESTSSPADIPASPSHLPGSKKAQKTTATSGRQCLSLLSKKDPLLSLARTLLVTSRWASTKCFLTWKVKATPRGRLLFQLLPSMPSTDETGSGLLHTPTRKANQTSPDMLKRGSGWGPKMWATPAAADSKGTTGGGQGKSLRTDVRMWPTPMATDGAKNVRTVKGAQARIEAGKQVELGAAVRLWPTPRAGKTSDENEETWMKRHEEGKVATPPLGLAVKMWPTPRASEWKGTGPIGSKSHEYRLQKGYLDATVQERSQTSGSLNPDWVEWLMGYPEGWTDLNR